jgi:hypothetical protein
MTDALDGRVGRRVGPRRTTWTGERDFAVDVLKVMALLCHLTTTSVVAWQGALTYLIVAGIAICFLREQAVTLVFMAPVDGLFPHTGLRRAPTGTRLVLLYLAVSVVLDWLPFCCVTSVFLGGMRQVLHE